MRSEASGMGPGASKPERRRVERRIGSRPNPTRNASDVEPDRVRTRHTTRPTSNLIASEPDRRRVERHAPARTSPIDDTSNSETYRVQARETTRRTPGPIAYKPATRSVRARRSSPTSLRSEASDLDLRGVLAWARKVVGSASLCSTSGPRHRSEPSSSSTGPACDRSCTRSRSLGPRPTQPQRTSSKTPCSVSSTRTMSPGTRGSTGSSVTCPSS